MFPSLNRFLQPKLSYSVRCVQTNVVQTKKDRIRHRKGIGINSIHNALVSELNGKPTLSIDEWKTFAANLQQQNISCGHRTVFPAIKCLDVTTNRIELAENFIEAFNVERDVFVNRTIIDLIALKGVHSDLTAGEEQKAIELCNEFITNGMYQLSGISASLTNALCATKEWRRALDLPKIGMKPTSMNILIRKALQERDIKLVWHLIDALSESELKELSMETIQAFWRFCGENKPSCRDNIERMLQALEKNEVILNEAAAIGLIEVLTKLDHHCQAVQLDHTGTCQVCNKCLDTVSLTDEQFKLLQKNFLEKVVQVGSPDIYQKTNPDEWNSFVELVDQEGPFDIVIDGLNVLMARNDGKHEKIPNAVKLVSVVEQFVKDGKSVLVIGRQEMRKWIDIDYLNSISSTFIVDKLSKDDIFLLYGAMKSGPNTSILSNDQMKDHKYLTGPGADAIFKKWQQMNSFAFKFDEQNQFQAFQLMKFKMYCHQYNEQWHVPFVSEAERKSFDKYKMPTNWICIRL